MSHRSIAICAKSLPMLLSLAGPSCAGLIFTTERTATPGAPGYFTYDVTATIEVGYFNTFDFFGSKPEGGSREITGPLLQTGAAGVYSSDVADTGFLVDPALGLELRTSESSDSLLGVFSYFGSGIGDHNQRHTHRSWTFARLVTNAPEEVRLDGAMLSERWYSDGAGDNLDGSMGELIEHHFDVSLSEIPLDAPPVLGAFPDRPATPPVVLPTPPVADPPANDPPVNDPPVVQPPPVSQPDPPAPEVDPPATESDPQPEVDPKPAPDPEPDPPIDAVIRPTPIENLRPYPISIEACGDLVTLGGGTIDVWTWRAYSEADLTEFIAIDHDALQGLPTITAYDGYVADAVAFRGALNLYETANSHTPEPAAGLLLLAGLLPFLSSIRGRIAVSGRTLAAFTGRR